MRWLWSVVLGAVGLVAAGAALLVIQGLPGYSGVDQWWALLALPAAGVAAAAIDRRWGSYLGAVGGALLAAVAYFIWYANTHGLGPFDALFLPIVVVVVLPSILFGWYPAAKAMKRRENGARNWFVPILAGIGLAVAVIWGLTMVFASSPTPESPVETAAPTAMPTPAPTLPPGTAAPPAPTNLTATTRVAPCSGQTGSSEFIQAHVVASTFCTVVDLGWTPAEGANAVYRIYEAWSGEGVGAVCAPADAKLIATSPPNAIAITVGPLAPPVPGGGRCLYVAAANSAGESARVQFKGDFIGGDSIG